MTEIGTDLTIYYLDTSVVIAAIAIDESPSATRWLATITKTPNTPISSRLLEVEVVRSAKRRAFDLDVVKDYLDPIFLTPITEQICTDAIALEPPLRGADAIHVATAQQLSGPDLVLATHDQEMAAAARQLGLNVFDPVTDDPNHAPVANQ